MKILKKRRNEKKKIGKKSRKNMFGNCVSNRKAAAEPMKKTQTCRKMFENTRIHICTTRTCVLLWKVFCCGCDVHRVDDGLNLCICELIYKEGQSHAYCGSIRTECLVDVVPHTVKATI